MTNLVFLEAAAQSDTADLLVDSNSNVIDFAVSEVDSLVEEQANYTAWNVGDFIEESIETTYESVEDPISDLVVEASSIFADIIACEELTESEKIDAISGWAHIVSMGDAEEVLETFPEAQHAATERVRSKFNATAAAVDGPFTEKDYSKLHDRIVSSQNTIGARAARSLIMSIFGTGMGIISGGVIARIVLLFSKERKAWKSLAKQEKTAREEGASVAKLKKIQKDKEKLYSDYKEKLQKTMRSYKIKGAAIGAATGAIYGAVKVK